MSVTYRKFDGKRYEKEQTVWSKREAQNVARLLRFKGINARIVKAPAKEAFGASGEAWIVYIRRSARKA